MKVVAVLDDAARQTSARSGDRSSERRADECRDVVNLASDGVGHFAEARASGGPEIGRFGFPLERALGFATVRGEKSELGPPGLAVRVGSRQKDWNAPDAGVDLL